MCLLRWVCVVVCVCVDVLFFFVFFLVGVTVCVLFFFVFFLVCVFANCAPCNACARECNLYVYIY